MVTLLHLAETAIMIRIVRCAGSCYNLADVVGTTFTGGVPFSITPPTGSPGPGCEVNLAELCP